MKLIISIIISFIGCFLAIEAYNCIKEYTTKKTFYRPTYDIEPQVEREKYR